MKAMLQEMIRANLKLQFRNSSEGSKKEVLLGVPAILTGTARKITARL
jgi:hypothetical protein